MARLVVPITPVVAGYPATPLAASALDFVWTNAGASFGDGAGFVLTGREVLLIRNANVGAQTVTIQSVNDAQNRKGDITAFSFAAGEFGAIQLPVAGWRQPDGQLYFAASATDVAFAVLRLPALPV